MMTLSTDALQLYSFIHRGGPHRYLWGHTGAKDSNGTTRWFRDGDTPAVFNSNQNNYHGVHPTKAAGTSYQRAKKGERDIAAINCLYTDIDDKDYGGARGAACTYLESRIARGEIPAPTVTVATGGGVQPYWIFPEPFILDTDTQRDRADWLQKRWVGFIGADDGAKDQARVLRVPGTLNYKYDPPRPVEIIEADYSRLYTLDELEALLPALPAPKERAPRRIRDEGAPAPSSSSDHDFDTIADAARNLGHLAAARRDAYNDWIHVGMALRELGSIGYELWEKWSKLSGKYQPGDCAEKWRTFKPGTECDGYTLDSLARWAREDDPEHTPAAPEEVQQQLEAYKQREAWQAKILARKDIRLNEKAVMIGIEPILRMRRDLGSQKADHSGTVPAAYQRLGELVATSPSTVGRVIDLGEKIEMWRRDPEPMQTSDGYDIQLMRLDLLPAFDNPDQAQPIERKVRGGARPGAGRKPKCPLHPTARVIEEITTVTTQYCEDCGKILHTNTTQHRRELLDEIKHEIGDVPDHTEIKHEIEPAETADVAGVQHETEGTTSLSASMPAAPPTDIHYSAQFAPALAPTPDRIEIIGAVAGPAPPAIPVAAPWRGRQRNLSEPGTVRRGDSP